MSGAYYNENDEDKAAWLRELIRSGIIAAGEVDTRSIAEVLPEDLAGFSQHHFFAGIGVWSYALRLADWPDDRPVWTGSCPCPSFSAAGKGKGFADPRHLWPYWSSLIRECKPATVFGEQVASAIGHGWLDVVYVDLEAAAYAVGAVVLGACSVGAPHIRQRLYLYAHAECDGGRTDFAQREAQGRIADGRDRATGIGSQPESGRFQQHDTEQWEFREPDAGRESSECSDSDGWLASDGDLQRGGQQRLLAEDRGTGEHGDATERGQPVCGSTSGIAGHAALADETSNCSQPISERLERFSGDERNRRGPGWLDANAARSIAAAGATRGFWADCDWWYGRDGKYRPIEPGVFPLAHGVANRVLKLRGYGDAICAEVAKAFIEAVMEFTVLEAGESLRTR